MLDRAKVLKLRAGDNPARWKGNLDQLLPPPSRVSPVKHHPALPYKQIPAFMAELSEREGIAARALEFLILTGTRTADVIEAPRDGEIDEKERVWTIPAERLKGEKGTAKVRSRHSIVRSGPKDFRGLPTAGKYLFPGPRASKHLSNAAMATVIDRMNKDREVAGLPRWIDPKRDRDIVPHGFRSTFTDWGHEVAGQNKETMDMATAHVVKDKTEQAYRRGDLLEKRRRVMTNWASYCYAKPATGENVETMRGRR